MAGIEAIPWRSCNRWTDGVLSIERAISESGNLYIPWDVPGHGHRVLATCTLMERDQPYCLATELARGTLHRARTLVGDLEAEGVRIPGEIRAQLRASVASFIRATTDDTCAEDDAATTIRIASDVIAYIFEELLPALTCTRREFDGPLPALLAGQLGNRPFSESAAHDFLKAFQAVSIPFRWRDLQPSDDIIDSSRVQQQLAWCREHGLRVFGGPLIQLDRLSLPDWVHRWETNYEAFEDAATKYIYSIAERFSESVDIWLCSGRLNVAGAVDFSEEQRLRLAVATIEAVRHASPRTPVVISFDQPWAEYLANEDHDLSPLHFADALVRAELGVAGVGLELNFGYWPGGTLPRDFLAISRHIDRWSLLGIPLIVYLTMPSSGQKDPNVVGNADVILRNGNVPTVAAMDQELAEYMLPLLLTKPALHGIIWNQLSDVDPHEFPNSGLFDREDHAKPILPLLAAIREQLLS